MFFIKTIKELKKSFFSNHGKNNRVLVMDENGNVKQIKHLKNCRIKFKGDNNTIKIHEPIGNLSLDIIIYNNTNITLMPSVFQREIKIHGFDNNNNNIYIGKDFSTSAVFSVMLLRGNGDITIGDDCMIAWNDEIRLGDGHNIIDTRTKNIINNNQNIIIGNHVWISADVMMLKGAQIPDNCVIGVRSVVTKSFNTPNSVIAGAPARVIKTGTDWTRKSQY